MHGSTMFRISTYGYFITDSPLSWRSLSISISTSLYIYLSFSLVAWLDDALFFTSQLLQCNLLPRHRQRNITFENNLPTRSFDFKLSNFMLILMRWHVWRRSIEMYCWCSSAPKFRRGRVQFVATTIHRGRDACIFYCSLLEIAQ